SREDETEGDEEEFQARPAAFYRRRFAALGLRQVGSHCWLSPALAGSAAALELAPVGACTAGGAVRQASHGDDVPRPSIGYAATQQPLPATPMLLYQFHELTRSWMTPLTYWAEANARAFSTPGSWLSGMPGAERVAAANELVHRIGKDYEKPAFDIHSLQW